MIAYSPTNRRIPVILTQRVASPFLKNLVWLYLILLLGEGALRKWIFPGLSNPLLIIRDPLVMMIYFKAASERLYPQSGFLTGLYWIGFISLLFSIFANEVPIAVMLYGMRVNFLHIPLIFALPKILNREDLNRMGKFLLWTSVGMSALVILQFYSPITAWINRSTGGEIGGLIGAKGRFRPNGTFAFVTGVACYYPLVTAFLLENFLGQKKFPMIILTAFAFAIVVSIPFTISRQTALGCALIVLFSIFAAQTIGSNIKYIQRATFACIGLIGIMAITPFMTEGVDAFTERWLVSTTQAEGGFQQTIIYRFFEDQILALESSIHTPFFGYGLGFGSNFGAKYLTGSVGFLLAEGEWSRIIVEMGGLMGWIFIFYRLALCFYITFIAYHASKKNKDSLPLLILGIALPMMFNGQWGPPTTLGFAIITAGFCLTAAQNPPEQPHFYGAPQQPSFARASRRQLRR